METPFNYGTVSYHWHCGVAGCDATQETTPYRFADGDSIRKPCMPEGWRVVYAGYMSRTFICPAHTVKIETLVDSSGE